RAIHWKINRHPRRFVARSDDARAIRANLRAPHPLLMPSECGEEFARRRIPYMRGIVNSCGDDAGTVRAALRAEYATLVPSERSEAFARHRIPHPRHFVA